MSTIEIILISASAGVGGLSLLYGFFRKASRVSWVGWQVFALFALTFLFDVITPPEIEEGGWYFWTVAGVFAGALGLDLMLGGIIRARMINCELPYKSMVWWSRILGALCALMNAALLFSVIASFALAIFGVTPAYPEFLQPVYESSVWTDFLSKHIYDLFIITVCFLFVRAGLRIGFIHAVYYLLMAALTFASFFGAILLVTKVGFFANWGAALSAQFGSLPPTAASVLGYGLFALLFFAIFFAVVLVIGWFLHKGLRRALDSRTLGIISSVILFLIFLAVFFAAMCGLYYGVAYLVQTVTSQFEFMGEFAIGEMIEGLFTSSPLSAAFYWYNPFLPILG